MNSLNRLSAIAPTPPTPRSRSASSGGQGKDNQFSDPRRRGSVAGQENRGQLPAKTGTPTPERDDDSTTLDEGDSRDTSMAADEQTPLLGETNADHFGDVNVKIGSGWRAIPKRISSAVIGTIRVVFTTVAAPGRYVIACFYDGEGRFSPFLPIISIYRFLSPRKRKKTPQTLSSTEKQPSNRNSTKQRSQKKPKRPPSLASSTTAVATDSEFDEKRTLVKMDDPRLANALRSKSSFSADGDEIAPARRSIRIKLHNEEVLSRRRKQQEEATTNPSKEDAKELVAASLKSPSSPGVSKLTRFPRGTPAPPRPLIPRRQPSYSNVPSTGPHQKTLILDLDETLIHSHSKGGRFATGHMVEVKMQHSMGVGGTFIGPQVPILYYVHKRPHCDEFLRKVAKWYNLVIFTASVQEYADPVIDWLELERSYFSGRYYRQHCTQRNGAYIKDLSQVEADLSRVMIVDNSPVSYVFHEDNAIPIEGWISDPTDHDLLNLIPLLEGLQYATDVRALLALRLGQPQIESA